MRRAGLEEADLVVPVPDTAKAAGDAFAYAAAGPATGGVPNTDPLRGAAYRLVATNVQYFDRPGMTVAAVGVALLLRNHWALPAGILGRRVCEVLLSYGMHQQHEETD